MTKAGKVEMPEMVDGFFRSLSGLTIKSFFDDFPLLTLGGTPPLARRPRFLGNFFCRFLATDDGCGAPAGIRSPARHVHCNQDCWRQIQQKPEKMLLPMEEHRIHGKKTKSESSKSKLHFTSIMVFSILDSRMENDSC